MIKKITLGSYLVALALYPILALRSQNLVYVKFASIVRSLLLSLLLAFFLLLIFKLLVKRWDKARLLATLTLVLFFSYGHIYLQLQEHLESPIRHRYLVVIFAIIFLLLSVFIIRLKNTLSVEQFLAVFGLILFVFPFYQAVNYDFSVARATRLAEQDVREKVERINGSNTQDLPDIYLIILDGYTRSDIMTPKN